MALTAPPPVALLAVDWGTTSARAYRIDADGNILDARSAPLGIQNVEHGEYAAAFDRLLDGWHADPAPRIACGMIGSRQGWIEAPYVACPMSLTDLGGSLATTPGRELAIVPGARCVDRAGIPDVMRGEETQLAGAIAPDAGRVVAVLPGTHSKWAIVEHGRLVEFATFMTGELYAVLLAHSIIGRMSAASASGEGGAPSRGVVREAFARGVACGLLEHGLTHLIFGARSLALMGELAPADVADWLSGALMGYEIHAARKWVAERGGMPAHVTVIGGEALASRYVAALAQAGVDASPGIPDAAARGLFRIAQQAGLVGRAGAQR